MLTEARREEHREERERGRGEDRREMSVEEKRRAQPAKSKQERGGWGGGGGGGGQGKERNRRLQDSVSGWPAFPFEPWAGPECSTAQRNGVDLRLSSRFDWSFVIRQLRFLF